MPSKREEICRFHDSVAVVELSLCRSLRCSILFVLLFRWLSVVDATIAPIDFLLEFLDCNSEREGRLAVADLCSCEVRHGAIKEFLIAIAPSLLIPKFYKCLHKHCLSRWDLLQILQIASQVIAVELPKNLFGFKGQVFNVEIRIIPHHLCDSFCPCCISFQFVFNFYTALNDRWLWLFKLFIQFSSKLLVFFPCLCDSFPFAFCYVLGDLGAHNLFANILSHSLENTWLLFL